MQRQDAVMAMRRRDIEPAYRVEDKTFLLSCPLISARGTKTWLLNVESVHNHADMLLKIYFLFFPLLQLLPISVFSGGK